MSGFDLAIPLSIESILKTSNSNISKVPTSTASFARSSKVFVFTSVAKTCAPSAAIAKAVALPIPCPAAVTKALLPCRRFVIS